MSLVRQQLVAKAQGLGILVQETDSIAWLRSAITAAERSGALLESQAAKDLGRVSGEVKAGRYRGGETITYSDGSRIYIDLESQTVVAGFSGGG
jgi:hypothetical protein